jgi:hypothetical protein
LEKLSKCETEILMMNAIHWRVHRTVASLKKGGFVVADRMNRKRTRSKTHAISDGSEKPVRLLLTVRKSMTVGFRKLPKD